MHLKNVLDLLTLNKNEFINPNTDLTKYISEKTSLSLSRSEEKYYANETVRDIGYRRNDMSM